MLKPAGGAALSCTFGPMPEFRRRTYRSAESLLADLRSILSQRALLRSTMRGGLNAAFRERLMLVVTAVNGCRYCSYAHAHQALSQGISPQEIKELSRGTLDGTPDEETTALLYAQHWAEADGDPDPNVRDAVEGVYGVKTLQRIEIVLRMIRVGNLLGNTLDYSLYRLSFGHWGRARKKKD